MLSLGREGDPANLPNLFEDRKVNQVKRSPYITLKRQVIECKKIRCDWNTSTEGKHSSVGVIRLNTLRYRI